MKQKHTKLHKNMLIFPFVTLLLSMNFRSTRGIMMVFRWSYGRRAAIRVVREGHFQEVGKESYLIDFSIHVYSFLCML